MCYALELCAEHNCCMVLFFVCGSCGEECRDQFLCRYCSEDQAKRLSKRRPKLASSPSCCAVLGVAIRETKRWDAPRAQQQKTRRCPQLLHLWKANLQNPSKCSTGCTSQRGPAVVRSGHAIPVGANPEGLQCACLIIDLVARSDRILIKPSISLQACCACQQFRDEHAGGQDNAVASWSCSTVLALLLWFIANKLHNVFSMADSLTLHVCAPVCLQQQQQQPLEPPQQGTAAQAQRTAGTTTLQQQPVTVPQQPQASAAVDVVGKGAPAPASRSSPISPAPVQASAGGTSAAAPAAGPGAQGLMRAPSSPVAPGFGAGSSSAPGPHREKGVKARRAAAGSEVGCKRA